MKKSFKSTLFVCCAIIGICPLLTQCASQSEINNLHYQLRIVSKKVDNMKADTVTSIQKRQASSSSQLDRIETDMTQLKSRIEELAHLNRLLQEQQKENRAALQSLSAKIEKQEEEAKAIQAARIKEAERKAREAQLIAEKARAQRKLAETSAAQSRKSSGVVETIHARKGNKVIKYTPTAPQSQSQSNVANDKQDGAENTANVSLDQLLQQGNQAFKQQKFQEALTIFQKIVSRDQSSQTAITARFMMAESLYNMQQYNQAIMEYQKIIVNYPRDPKAATALLRQGKSFENLSELDTTKMIYKKLIRSHGSSPEAAKAKELLEKL